MSPWLVSEIARAAGGIVLVYVVLLVARLMQRRLVSAQDRALDVLPRRRRPPLSRP